MKNYRNWLCKLWAVIRSKKLAFTLILTLLLVVTVQVILSADVNTNFLGADQKKVIFSSPLFATLCVLLLVNLTACTTYNTVRRLKHGWRNLNLWGSTVFHCGLAVVLCGGFLASQYQTVSQTTLIQDERKLVPYKIVTSQPFFRAKSSSSGFYINLRQLETNFDYEGKIREEYSHLQIIEVNTILLEGRLTGSDKLTYQGVSMYPKESGYAVILEISEGKSGSAENRRKLTIPLLTQDLGNGARRFTAANYKSGDFPYRLSLQLFPDVYKTQDGKILNKSFALGKPAIMVNVEGSREQSKNQVLFEGDGIEANGYQVTFKGVRPWVTMEFMYDPGAGLILAGAALSISGLSVYYLFMAGRLKRDDSEQPEEIDAYQIF